VSSAKKCVLEPHEDCTDCGDCRRCDLNPEKVCDNCCQCLGDADYRAVVITEILWPERAPKKTGQQDGKDQDDKDEDN